MVLQDENSIHDRVSTVLLEYAQVDLREGRLNPSLSLRNDLAIESLSLVSVVLPLSEEFGVDIVDAGLELHAIKTVGDLIALSRTLQQSVSPQLH